jgi:hypothetical protein
VIKVATIQLTSELLRQALCIPGDVSIERCVHRETDDTFHLVLRGDGLPGNCQISETEPAKALVGMFFRDDETEVVFGVQWRAG